MSIKRSYISSPTLTFAILCMGLGCIVSAVLNQNLAIAGLVAILPAFFCILILHLRKPERFIFLLFIFNYFLLRWHVTAGKTDLVYCLTLSGGAYCLLSLFKRHYDILSLGSNPVTSLP